MSPRKIKALLTEATLKTTGVQRFSQIQVMLRDRMRELSSDEDQSTFELLLGNILIHNGRRRSRNEIFAYYPLVVLMCEDRNLTSRAADMPAPIVKIC